MKLTLKQRREIVQRFKAGYSALLIQKHFISHCEHYLLSEHYLLIADIERTLRDYMNGKFTLEPKRKGKK